MSTLESSAQDQLPLVAPYTDNARVLMLMYHHIGRFSRPKNCKGLYCHVDRFRAQMRMLDRLGIPVISLPKAYEGLFGNGELPKKSVVLTFDDGFQDFHDYAWPVLHEYRNPATVFAVTDQIGQKADWDGLVGEKAQSPELMDAHTLRELAADDLVTIGSHTRTHPYLETLAAEEQRRELVDSRQHLEDILDQPVRHLCYPYGGYNDDTVAIAREAGYLTGISTKRARDAGACAESARNAFEIPRRGVSYKHSPLRFAGKLMFKYFRT